MQEIKDFYEDEFSKSSGEDIWNQMQPKKEESYRMVLQRVFNREISPQEEADYSFKLEHNLCFVCNKTGVESNGFFVICKEHQKIVAKELDKRPKKPLLVSEKYGRNSFCQCGSGKKYKNCCISKVLTLNK